MRRLHWRVYLTVVGTLLVFLIAAFMLLHLAWPAGVPFEAPLRRGALLHGLHVGLLLTIVAAVLALLTYPITRGITARLARLEAAVRQFGGGNLAVRVPVEGRDEVASLATSFNEAADRIAELVASHKLLLANCSHELRTPLTRLRLAVEKLGGEALAANPELARNIEELDALIGEMLLSSALDAGRGVERRERIDLLALVAEEAAHFDREAEGAAVEIDGDAALLRRLVRNLLENAARHAGGASAVRVERAGDAARIVVEDSGAGVPAAARERIFEPFYRIPAAPDASAAPGATTSSAARPVPKRGTGLGLAIVRQIARAHGGTAVCEAREGGGSRFVVTLPLPPA